MGLNAPGDATCMLFSIKIACTFTFACVPNHAPQAKSYNNDFKKIKKNYNLTQCYPIRIMAIIGCEPNAPALSV